jgi:hypothetical protein
MKVFSLEFNVGSDSFQHCVEQWAGQSKLFSKLVVGQVRVQRSKHTRNSRSWPLRTTSTELLKVYCSARNVSNVLRSDSGHKHDFVIT